MGHFLDGFVHLVRVGADALQVDEGKPSTFPREKNRGALEDQPGGTSVSFTRAITIMGEGHYGSMRAEPIIGDPYAFMDSAPTELEPLHDGRVRRFKTPGNQRFLDKIRRDVEAGKINVKKLCEGRHKSPDAH